MLCSDLNWMFYRFSCGDKHVHFQSKRWQTMVCENDILEIPEKYKKMSAEELDKEIEMLYETMKDQNKGEVREKVAKLPVDFFFK